MWLATWYGKIHGVKRNLSCPIRVFFPHHVFFRIRSLTYYVTKTFLFEMANYEMFVNNKKTWRHDVCSFCCVTSQQCLGNVMHVLVAAMWMQQKGCFNTLYFFSGQEKLLKIKTGNIVNESVQKETPQERSIATSSLSVIFDCSPRARTKFHARYGFPCQIRLFWRPHVTKIHPIRFQQFFQRRDKYFYDDFTTIENNWQVCKTLIVIFHILASWLDKEFFICNYVMYCSYSGCTVTELCLPGNAGGSKYGQLSNHAVYSTEHIWTIHIVSTLAEKRHFVIHVEFIFFIGFTYFRIFFCPPPPFGGGHLAFVLSISDNKILPWS